MRFTTRLWRSLQVSEWSVPEEDGGLSPDWGDFADELDQVVTHQRGSDNPVASRTNRLRDAYTTDVRSFVLISGDSDFTAPLDLIRKDRNKQVLVFNPKERPTDSIVGRIAGVDPAVCLSRFDDYPPSKGRLGFPWCLWEKPFPVNEKFWLKDVDFSCASPWSDESGTVRAGTLISKRHIIFAEHFPLWKGVRILFADQQGEVCPCRVEATKALDDCDIMIGLLDYEVTPNIRPAKILPDDYEQHIGNGRGLPIVTFNQHEKALLSECRGISTNSISNVASTNAAWKALGGKIVKGDSGNPAFLLIGNEPILIYCLYSGGSGHGPAIHRYRHEIQRAMDELCPGYKLECFDFSKLKH